jgi:hypothetical protein
MLIRGINYGRNRICVGSSCHLKGSYDVIEAFTEEVKKRHLEDKIELKAAFCLGKCGYDGVSDQSGRGQVITGVTRAAFRLSLTKNHAARPVIDLNF